MAGSPRRVKAGAARGKFGTKEDDEDAEHLALISTGTAAATGHEFGGLRVDLGGTREIRGPPEADEV